MIIKYCCIDRQIEDCLKTDQLSAIRYCRCACSSLCTENTPALYNHGTPGSGKCKMYTESVTTRVSPLYAKSVTANGLFILVVKRTFVTGWFCGPVFVPNSHSAPGYVDQVKAITVGGVSTDIWLIPQPLTYIARE